MREIVFPIIVFFFLKKKTISPIFIEAFSAQSHLSIFTQSMYQIILKTFKIMIKMHSLSYNITYHSL